MAMLSVQGVSKRYGRLVALNELNLSVASGEFVALLGPNGAGKSTLFQLLTGLFAADSGSVLVAGKDLKSAPVDALKNIGVVFQQPTLDLDLSIFSNLRFFCRLQGVAADEAGERIGRALAEIGLHERRDERVRNLSGGNRRKIELVRALLHRPSVLLMDEPTVGLDPASRSAILTQVTDRCRTEGIAVLWATHLVGEAERADRVVILNRGRKLVEGCPDKLVAESGETSLESTFLKLTGSNEERE